MIPSLGRRGTYRTSRSAVHAKNAVCTSQPLASTVGLDIMKAGGNAVDAAVAMAACMTVVEPTTNGIGSDMFAIVNDGDDLVGLNASGKSPAGWTRDRFSGRDQMPTLGWDAVTVPGCVSGWAQLSERFGKLPFEQLMAPAAKYAREGFPVSPIIAGYWSRAEERFGDFDAFRDTFLPEPKAGDIWKSEDHATTLEEIGKTKGESFYRGELAKRIAAASAEAGGAMTEDDLAEHEPIWFDEAGLVSSEGFGVTLYEIPPNGQGIAATMAWRICQEIAGAMDVEDWYSERGLHLQLEAMKVAFADLYAYVADSDAMTYDPKSLVDPAYLAERAKLVSADKAEVYAAGVPTTGGTINLTTADESGMMVSLIQSNYAGFGSGIVVPGTGIAMQNRGAGFVLTEGHPNEVGPRKRPFHTIIPGFVKKNGKPHLAFQLMGGPMQAQGHLQMMLHLFAAGHGLQEAIDAPRWQITQGHEVTYETGFDESVIESLRQKGHLMERRNFISFGGAQMIRRLDNGTFEAASDPRKDGHAAGY